MSESKYPDSLPEPEEITAQDLTEILDSGYQLVLEPASRLLYRQQADSLDFWANAENIHVSKTFERYLKQIADGESLAFDQELNTSEILEDIAQLLNAAILMMLPPH